MLIEFDNDRAQKSCQCSEILNLLFECIWNDWNKEQAEIQGFSDDPLKFTK